MNSVERLEEYLEIEQEKSDEEAEVIPSPEVHQFLILLKILVAIYWKT